MPDESLKGTKTALNKFIQNPKVAWNWYFDHKNLDNKKIYGGSFVNPFVNYRGQSSELTPGSHRSTSRVISWSGDTNSNSDWCSSCLNLSVYSGSIATRYQQIIRKWWQAVSTILCTSSQINYHLIDLNVCSINYGITSKFLNLHGIFFI